MLTNLPFYQIALVYPFQATPASFVWQSHLLFSAAFSFLWPSFVRPPPVPFSPLPFAFQKWLFAFPFPLHLFFHDAPFPLEFFITVPLLWVLLPLLIVLAQLARWARILPWTTLLQSLHHFNDPLSIAQLPRRKHCLCAIVIFHSRFWSSQVLVTID